MTPQLAQVAGWYIAAAVPDGAEAATIWPEGSERFFGGPRPIEVLAIDGTAPVLEALDAFEQGGFA